VRRILQLCWKLFSYLLYRPKTFASVASFLKMDNSEAWKIS